MNQHFQLYCSIHNDKSLAGIFSPACSWVKPRLTLKVPGTWLKHLVWPKEECGLMCIKTFWCCMSNLFTVQTKPPNIRPALRESVAVKLGPGVNSRPNLRPKKKKDPGAFGMSSHSSIKVYACMHTVHLSDIIVLSYFRISTCTVRCLVILY